MKAGRSPRRVWPSFTVKDGPRVVWFSSPLPHPVTSEFSRHANLVHRDLRRACRNELRRRNVPPPGAAPHLRPSVSPSRRTSPGRTSCSGEYEDWTDLFSSPHDIAAIEILLLEDARPGRQHVGGPAGLDLRRAGRPPPTSPISPAPREPCRISGSSATRRTRSPIHGVAPPLRDRYPRRDAGSRRLPR
jgi:hypothetical protein